MSATMSCRTCTVWPAWSALFPPGLRGASSPAACRTSAGENFRDQAPASSMVSTACWRPSTTEYNKQQPFADHFDQLQPGAGDDEADRRVRRGARAASSFPVLLLFRAGRLSGAAFQAAPRPALSASWRTGGSSRPTGSAPRPRPQRPGCSFGVRALLGEQSDDALTLEVGSADRFLLRTMLLSCHADSMIEMNPLNQGPPGVTTSSSGSSTDQDKNMAQRPDALGRPLPHQADQLVRRPR